MENRNFSYFWWMDSGPLVEPTRPAPSQYLLNPLRMKVPILAIFIAVSALGTSNMSSFHWKHRNEFAAPTTSLFLVLLLWTLI